MTTSIGNNPITALLAANAQAARAGRVADPAAIAQQAQRVNPVRNVARAPQDQGDATQNPNITTQNLTVRAQPGAALRTDFEFETGPDGQRFVSGVNISSEQAGAAAQVPSNNAASPGAASLNTTTALTDNRPRNFADIVAPRVSLNPFEEAQLFSAEARTTGADNASAASVASDVLANQGAAGGGLNNAADAQDLTARRQLQATAQYQQQSDLVFTTNPVFDAAA
jgi:hypothetical protein